MDDRIKAGDTVKLDTDMWVHHGQEFYVHTVKYRENSTATELTLEDNNSNIFTITIASHQIIKVL